MAAGKNGLAAGNSNKMLATSIPEDVSQDATEGSTGPVIPFTAPSQQPVEMFSSFLIALDFQEALSELQICFISACYGPKTQESTLPKKQVIDSWSSCLL